MKTIIVIFLLLAIAGMVAGSLFLKKKKKRTAPLDPTPTAVFPFRANTPTQSFNLPHKLREISDLSYDPVANVLWTIADEKGVLYRIGLPDATPIDAFPFGAPSDYEGVELVGDKVFAMASIGRIIRILNPTAEKPDTTFFDYPSLAGDDLEAFAYDPKRGQLILGVKTPQNGSDVRPFYTVDPTTMKLDQTPIFQISLEKIQAFLRKNGTVDGQYERWFKKRAKVPSPSALAIHPQTGNYFILASAGEALLVTKPNGEILQVVGLDSSVHAQPEGITFDTKGRMYISNEANGGPPKLHVFAPQ